MTSPKTRRTDRNRTHQNINRVLSPRPCSSRLVARGGIEPPTFRFSGGRSYRLSYLAGGSKCLAALATLTGLEPATSAVTGRRANQLRHRALLLLRVTASRTPYGIRTRATALKGRRPRPLDEGGQNRISPGYSQRGYRWEPRQLRSPRAQSSNELDFSPSILNLRGPYSSVGRATDF